MLRVLGLHLRTPCPATNALNAISWAKDKGTTINKCDDGVTLLVMINGVYRTITVALNPITNDPSDRGTFGDGIGLSLNYIRVLKRLGITYEQFYMTSVSQSYDNGYFGMHVPYLVKEIFQLPEWHLHFRDLNHCMGTSNKISLVHCNAYASQCLAVSEVQNSLFGGANILKDIKRQTGPSALQPRAKSAVCNLHLNQLFSINHITYNNPCLSSILCN